MASNTRSWRNAYMQNLLRLRTGNGNSMKNTQLSKPTQETWKNASKMCSTKSFTNSIRIHSERTNALVFHGQLICRKLPLLELAEAHRNINRFTPNFHTFLHSFDKCLNSTLFFYSFFFILRTAILRGLPNKILRKKTFSVNWFEL